MATEGMGSHEMLLLGRFYSKGRPNGVVNEDKAFFWFERAAEAGNARAMVRLAKCYKKGLGTNQNWKLAVHWLRQAAEAGDVQGMKQLAHALERGRGVPQNVEAARQWYRKAAKAGDVAATARLAELGG